MSGTPIAMAAKAIKVTLVLDPAVVATMPPPANGTARVTLRIAASGRTLKADVAAKALGRCIETIRQAGPEAVACIVQGKLEAGDVLSEAGLVAQLKAPKSA
jgi:hypothetical protein